MRGVGQLRLSAILLQFIACFSLALILLPTLGTADPANMPVATNISGAVAVRSNGVRHDLVSSQILHSGDVVVTGMNSLAVVSLADIGRVLLGPATTARAYASTSRLDLQLSAGAVCVEAQKLSLGIDAGRLNIASASANTIFDLTRNGGGAKIAVYRGSVRASVAGAKPVDIKAGGAAISDGNDHPQQVPIETINQEFAALHCPDQSVIAQVVPNAGSTPTQSGGESGGGGGGGGAGGILGILLGLGGIAAAVGHGGSVSSNNSGPVASPTVGPTTSPTPQHSPSPSPSPSVPSPSPSPSVTPPSPSPSASATLMVSPTNLSFSDPGASPQSFTITDPGFSGQFTVDDSSCGGLEMLSPGPYNGPTAIVTVTPQDSGSCSINVSDGMGGSATVAISIGSTTLSVDHNSLNVKVGNSATFTAQEPGYSGAISVTSSNPAAAVVTPNSAPGPAVTFTVIGAGAGNAKITVSDNHGGSQNVLTFVSVGGIMLSTSTLQFGSPSDGPQVFTAHDSPPVTFSAVSSNANVATVSVKKQHHDSTDFSVAPTGIGQATIMVTDSDGGQAAVSVGVGTSPLKHARRSDLARRAGSQAPSQPHTAPVRPAPLSDEPALGKPAPPSTLQYPLTIGRSSIDVRIGGRPEAASISEINYRGLFAISSSDPTIVSVTSGTAAGPSAIVLVVGHRAGVATIKVADDHGGVQFIRVTVTAVRFGVR